MEISENLLLKLLGMKARRVKAVRVKPHLAPCFRIEFWKLLFLVKDEEL
jgi:hypothetical protein